MPYKIIFNSFYYYKEYREIYNLLFYDCETRMVWMFTHQPTKDKAHRHEIWKN